MVKIRAGCPLCGYVDLRPADIELRVGETEAYYSFTCPTCRERITKPADVVVLDLLAQGGVRPRSLKRDVPAEVLEPKLGPRLTYDDLLDFMVALNATDTLAALPEMPCV